MIDYTTTVKKAKEIKKGVETDYKLVASTPVYYIAKQILKPKSKVEKIDIALAKQSTGDYFSRQIYKSTYIDMAERLCKYVEKNHQLPNNIKDNQGKLMNVRDYVYMFSRILVYYDNNGQLPKYANVNSKAYTKPTETGNEVYDYFVKKTGIKPTCIDDFCDWCKNKVEYEFYFDDKKSNKQVIDSKAGNCTDLTQCAVNIAEALNYEWKAIHVKCNQSGTGHIYPMFRKNNVNGGKWFVRDVACIADESRYCIWCEAGNGGSQIAVNPSWFIQNLHK